MKRFQYYGLSRRLVMATARKFIPIFEKYDREMLREIEGLARATNSKIEEILALNLRYELLWGSWASCTSFAIMPEASRDGHMLIGQNWDWIDSVRDNCHTWRIIRRGKPDLLCFTEAGIVGPKIGMNGSGISLNVNGLVSGADGVRTGVPFHLITRHILNSTSMYEALEFLESIKRVGSANYLIGHKQGEAIDVEAGPSKVGYLYPSEGILTHTNHFLSLSLNDVGRRRFPDSVVRYLRCQHLLRKADHIDVDYLQTTMRDHFDYPTSICYHSNESKPIEEREQTNASFIMDLTDQTMLLARGPPCENEYERLSLKE